MNTKKNLCEYVFLKQIGFEVGPLVVKLRKSKNKLYVNTIRLD